MILTICIFVILLFCFLRILGKNSSNRTIFIFSITFVLIIISGLRHPVVGNDTVNYLRAFDDARFQNWSNIFDGFSDAYFQPSSDTGKDPGLIVYNKFLNAICNSHVLYLMISAACLLIPLALFMKKHVTSLTSLLFSYLFFISIYYVYLPNSALRQSIALGILICGYNSLISKGKTFKLMLCIFLASIFHKSALLGFLMLLPKFFKNKKLLYILGFALLLIMYMEYEIVGVFLASQSDIYSMYASDYYAYGQTKPFIILLFFTGLYFLGLFTLDKYIALNKNNQISQYAICGTVFTVVFTPLILLDPSLIRITSYFIIWFMVFIPEIIRLRDSKISSIFFVVCVCLFLYKAYKSGGSYFFYWENINF